MTETYFQTCSDVNLLNHVGPDRFHFSTQPISRMRWFS